MAGQHGFARNLKWKIVDENKMDSSCTFKLEHCEATIKAWPHKFVLLYTVSLKSDGLHVRFEVQNCDDHEFTFTALLHTYFNIEFIDSVSINGLNGLHYADKLRNNENFTETRQIIENIQEEVDRNYFNVPESVNLKCINGNFEIKSDFKDLGNLAMIIIFKYFN